MKKAKSGRKRAAPKKRTGRFGAQQISQEDLASARGGQDAAD